MKKTIITSVATFLVLSASFLAVMVPYNWRGKVDLITYHGDEGEIWKGRWEDGETTEVVELIDKGSFIGELRNRANAIVRNYVVQDNGNEIFDVTYETDKWGRRVSSSHSKNKLDRKKFVAFFGGGDVLGMGASYADSLPAVFERSQEVYKAYNYGFVGSALNYLFRSFQINDYKQEIPEKEGLFIYFITEGHFPRTLGKFGHMHEPHMPYYVLEDNSELSFLGSYQEVQPFTTFIKKYAATAILSRLIDANEWTYYSNEDDHFVCETIKKSRSLVDENYPTSRLVYFLHETIREHDRLVLEECLQTHDIEHVSFMLESYDPREYETSGIDRHPTLAMNQLMTQMVLRYLEK